LPLAPSTPHHLGTPAALLAAWHHQHRSGTPGAPDAHRPGNAVGWIFSAVGLLTATGVLATEYAAYANRARPGGMPGAVLAAWYTSWWWYPTLVLVLVFTLLVFPTGRLLSARWRPVALVAGAGTAVIVTLSALQPTLEDEDSLILQPHLSFASLVVCASRSGLVAASPS
jgi:hypothetical protein